VQSTALSCALYLPPLRRLRASSPPCPVFAALVWSAALPLRLCRGQSWVRTQRAEGQQQGRKAEESIRPCHRQFLHPSRSFCCPPRRRPTAFRA
jgi:hypothetical protein